MVYLYCQDLGSIKARNFYARLGLGICRLGSAQARSTSRLLSLAVPTHDCRDQFGLVPLVGFPGLLLLSIFVAVQAIFGDDALKRFFLKKKPK